MVECRWAILCDNTFRDEQGKICVLGIFDRINAHSVPTTLDRAAIVVKFEGDPDETFSVKIDLVRPAGGVLLTVKIDGKIAPTGSCDINFNINRLQLPDWGNYTFSFDLGEGPPGPLTFNVSKIQQAVRPQSGEKNPPQAPG